MEKIINENTEISSEPHKMWAEGTCEVEPYIVEIYKYMYAKGWYIKSVEVWLDTMQGFWRWNCDLVAPTGDKLNN